MQKRVDAGQLTKIITHSRPRRHAESKQRAAKDKATTAAMQRANDRHSRERLEEMLYCNFSNQDFFCTLTYTDERLLHRWKYLKADIQRAIRRLRYHRGKRGDSLRYIYVVEGLHGDRRAHFHIVINRAESGTNILEEMRAAWDGGAVDVKRLADYETLGALARYLCKEQISDEGRAIKGINLWHASRNLAKPVVTLSGVDRAPFAPPGAVILERSSRMDFTGEQFSYVKYLRADKQQGEN